MKHLEIEQLKRYAARQSNADEVVMVVLHLDGCSNCFDSFQRMFPDLTDTAREVSLEVLTADDEGNFHLDYEAHLRPYIDSETDEVVREIVESHIRNCSFCDRAVRELREFSDAYKLRGTETDDFAGRLAGGESGSPPRRFSSGHLRYLILSALTISILGIGGWLVWRQSDDTNSIAENHQPTDAREVLGNGNYFYQSPNNSLMNEEIGRYKLPIMPRGDHSRGKKPEPISGNIPESKQPEADHSLVNALPPIFRVQFQNVLRTQKLNLPAFLADLRETVNLRGESDYGKKAIISPNAQAERSDRPTFRWRRIPRVGENYVVTIYDENFNRIAVSPSLQTAEWQSNVTLERGQTYRWQLETNQLPETYTAQFKVLDVEAVGRLKAIEKVEPPSSLARGIGYASEGLLKEAEQEFQKVILRNQNRRLAKKLRDSLPKN